MKWYKLALNPQSLENCYKVVPEVDDVELHTINLSNRSRIEISFDLPSFPDYPSTKWHKDFNTVQVHLSFWGVSKFEGKGLHQDMKVRIQIIRDEKDLKVVITNSEIDLRYSFLSQSLHIDRITAYQDSRKMLVEKPI
jgi:hypothetical protein